jgi:hypothetical protein
MERDEFMVPPFVSYITFNRLGLTAKNLKSVLAADEDFEIISLTATQGMTPRPL